MHKTRRLAHNIFALKREVFFKYIFSGRNENEAKKRIEDRLLPYISMNVKWDQIPLIVKIQFFFTIFATIT